MLTAPLDDSTEEATPLAPIKQQNLLLEVVTAD